MRFLSAALSLPGLLGRDLGRDVEHVFFMVTVQGAGPGLSRSPLSSEGCRSRISGPGMSMDTVEIASPGSTSLSNAPRGALLRAGLGSRAATRMRQGPLLSHVTALRPCCQVSRLRPGVQP